MGKAKKETEWLCGKNPRRRTSYEMGIIESRQTTSDKKGFSSFKKYVKAAQGYFPKALRIKCREFKTCYQTVVRQESQGEI